MKNKLNINEDWTNWSWEQWDDALTILQKTMPGLKMLDNVRAKLMEEDKLPSINQINVIKNSYKRHNDFNEDEEVDHFKLQQSINHTKIIMEKNKRVFDVKLTPDVEWVKTFEDAITYCEDCIPSEELLLTYFHKKIKLGYDIGIPSKLKSKFNAKYGVI